MNLRDILGFLGSLLSLLSIVTDSHGLDYNVNWVSRTLDPPFPIEGVRGIAESSQGSLWFSSWGNGLISYDGRNYKSYGIKDGLPTLYLRRCFFDREGSLWITSGDGLIRMRGGVFTTLDQGSGFPIQNTYSFAEDGKGRVFVGGLGGVVEILGEGKYTHLENLPETPPDRKVMDLYFDPELNVLWEGWDNGYIVPIDLDTLKPHSEMKAEQLWGGKGIQSFIRDKEGHLWVSCTYDIFRQEDEGWKSMKPDFISGRWGAYRMAMGSDGAIIFGTLRGVAIYDQGDWSIFDHRYIPEANQINTVLFSSRGSIWIGTRGKVSKLHRSPFETLLPNQPFEHRMTAVAFDEQGRLWVGGPSLSYLQEGQWTEVERREDGIKEHLVDVLIAPGDRVFSLWTRVGILEWKEGVSNWLPPPPVEPQNFSCMIETESEELWVGTEIDGILVWSDSEWTSLSQRCSKEAGSEIVDTKIITLFECSDGSVYIGGEGGLFRFQNCELTRIPGPMDGTEYEIVDIAERESGEMVIGISGLGLFELDAEEWSPIQDRECGFDTNLVTEIYHDPSGDIWVGTKADGMYYAKEGGWFHLGLSAGLAPCQVDSIDTGPNGDIYFVSDFLGLLRFRRDPNPPQTAIEAITRNIVHGENLLVTATGYDYYEETDRNDLRYSYRIDQGEWSSPTSTQPIAIPSLSTGSHTIEVAAIDLSGNRDPSPAMDRFVVTYPWWRHPLTLLLGFVLIINSFLLAGFLAQRFKNLNLRLEERKEYEQKLEEEVARRTNQLQEAVEFREKLITNVSHDFRTPLTNLIGYAQMLGSNPSGNLDTDQREFVEIIQNNANRMKRLIENVDQSLRGEGPLDKHLKSLVDLQEIAFDATRSHALLAEDQHIELELVCSQSRVEVLGSDVLIARLLDNLLSNAIKFSNPGGKVRMTIDQDENRTLLAVEDEGIGIHSQDLPIIFDRFSQAHRGLKDHMGGIGIGLSICKEIADYHQADISVESTLDEGSCFTVIWKREKPETTEMGI